MQHLPVPIPRGQGNSVQAKMSLPRDQPCPWGSWETPAGTLLCLSPPSLAVKCIFKQTLCDTSIWVEIFVPVEEGRGGICGALLFSSGPPLSLMGHFQEVSGLTTQSVVSGPARVTLEFVRDAEFWAPPLPTSIIVCNLTRSPDDSNAH